MVDSIDDHLPNWFLIFLVINWFKYYPFNYVSHCNIDFDLFWQTGDMPKRKRYFSKSTSVPVEANSLGLNENVSHGQPHSEPLSQIGLSSHHVGQTDPSP